MPSSSSTVNVADWDNKYLYPLLASKSSASSSRDWIKISAIVAAIVGALIAGLAVLCYMGIFPVELLGGPLGTGITLIAGSAIALPSAVVVYKRW
jgi:hypothetical protein